ncbi:hypothetical protein [Prevotella sp. P6B4]|uniref:hypothetical protein n=1 Tax=Prevotella sp. P6B4 TaxID=1410614 RepID=UPI0012DD80C7|nr:hypothetical protein [Prevotella sp. P6B4]
MNNVTNEIVRSQLGGALLTGYSATPEYLTKLKKNISLVREIARQYCDLTITDVDSRIYFVRYFVMIIKDVIKFLPTYIDELRPGRRLEAFCISSGVHRDDVFWKWCDTVCCDMEGQVVYHHLKESLDELRELLAEVENAMMHCDPAIFERFFYIEEQHYSSSGVARRFETWLYDNGYPDIDKLRELQAQVVAETLKMGVLDFAKTPSQKEIDEVNRDTLKGLLPYDFEMTADFIVACAKWRRFMHWDGYTLIVNYKKYGKYIQAHFYDFSDKQLQAIFELDMMVHLINEELARLNQVTTITITNHVPEEELFKFIHPSISGEEEWQIHEEVKRLVTHHGIQEICQYLYQMAKDKRILLPQMPSAAYAELVRMGMPTTAGFSEKYFKNHYRII